MTTTSDCVPCAEAAADGPAHFRASVDNSAWDGPAAMSNCAKSDTPASCYGSICAGKKAGDTSLQSSWALPHHKTPGGPPNAAGVANALSRLPQTQGLTNHDAALAHLQAHMHAIDPDYSPSSNSASEASLLRMRAYVEAGGSQIPNGKARAQLFTGAIFRATPVKQGSREYFEVEGYASVVDTPYTMYDAFGPYEETIRGSAFDASLANPALDVAFLVNHKGVTMARTTNGTLTLWVDSTGLGARAVLNAARQDVRDIVSAIDDGLIDEMSFAFYLNAGGWNSAYDKFTIFEADIDRGDVSAVNYGANPYTSIAARASEIIAEIAHLPAGAARAALARLQQRTDLTLGEPAIIPSTFVAMPARSHGAHSGEHTHMHPAYGQQGCDVQHTHTHTHAGDDNHDHQHGNEATAVEYRDPELDDQGSPAVQSGMSVQMLSELNELDNEYERDREDQ